VEGLQKLGKEREHNLCGIIISGMKISHRPALVEFESGKIITESYRHPPRFSSVFQTVEFNHKISV
jgi:hypothetical protein